eukprot:INCI13068.2.p1 GENE.INCI13068.2~~INCI13068.2.p1  ORF type:complete len:271 (-),score=29.09 INCI13068.2:928-1740(-)
MHADTMKMVRLNVPKPINRPPTTIMTDWFQNLVQWAWWKTALVFVCVLATLTFGFAGIYDALGPFPCPTDANASALSSFPDMLLYSTSITSTLLQARCIPLSSDEAMLVANFHGWVMLLITVFLTGVVFTRMAKPGMSVTMSSKMLFRFDDNIHGPTLVSRVFFDKPHYSLIDAKFNIMFTRKVRANFIKTDLLELVRPEAPLLVVGTNIIHAIDQDSPLFGMTMDDLFKSECWFVVTLQGTEASTMQTVFFSKLYTLAENMNGSCFEVG